jgi:transposase
VAARHRPPLRDPGPCPALHPFRPKRLLARSALRRPPGRGSTRFGASANATTGGAGRRARGARARALAGARDLYRVRQRLPGARERLTERERRRLCALFEREPLIAEAWALKQAFRSIYHAPDRHQAERRLDRFLAAVERAQLAAFTALADGVRLWRAEPLAYLDEPTTNRYAEGVINKIKPIKRRAHGRPASTASQSACS